MVKVAERKTDVSDKKVYEAVCGVLKRGSAGGAAGLTVADISAKTGLPLAAVKEAAPRAADEFNAKLSVTESGEILYSFPHGFKSRYKGFRAVLKRVSNKVLKGLVTAGKWAFKVWIMLMLIGYFAFFMLLALAALVLSIAASSSNNSSSRRSNDAAFGFIGGLFNMIIRLWFYSELLNLDRSYYYGRAPKKPASRPLHKAIFSFVFGDGDPNAGIEKRKKMALAAYIQANKGVINLEEYCAITGEKPIDADRGITAFCAEFGGSPEASEEGVIIYRFDDLLLNAEKNSAAVPRKKLISFSSNPKKMNGAFAAINAVNLLFGGYFLYNSLFTPDVFTNKINLFEYLYAVTNVLLRNVVENTPVFIFGVLGIVPVIFSLLFWLIPAVRNSCIKQQNKIIKTENYRQEVVKEIYEKPLSVKSPSKEYDGIIKELSFFGIPEITQDENNKTVYDFNDIKRDKDSTNKYRQEIKTYGIGKTVFDAG